MDIAVEFRIATRCQNHLNSFSEVSTSHGCELCKGQTSLDEIDRLMGAFLWKGVELKSAGAKVKWTSVCAPKREGGLGFKLMKDWNRASMLRHLWAISSKAYSLWIKWVHT